MIQVDQNNKRIQLLFEFMEANKGDDPNILTWGFPLCKVYHTILKSTGMRTPKGNKGLFIELIERETQMIKDIMAAVEKNWEEDE
jgi:hypothetical protein